MIYKVLNDGCRIPVLGLGTYKSAGSEGEAVICRAAELGYRLFDTAQMYGNEAEVGRGLKASGVPRGELFVVTKLGHKSYDNAYDSFMSSLERLGMDYVDMVLLHWPFGNYYAAWRVLEDMKDRGLVRSIGVSNFEPAALIDLINYNRITPSVNQLETHFRCMRTDHKPWLDKYHVAHMGYAPLGHGTRNDMLELPEVREIAAKYGKTGAQTALRYQIENDVIVIPKTAKPGRLEENINIFDFDLTEEDKALLAGLNTESPFIGTPYAPSKAEAAFGW